MTTLFSLSSFTVSKRWMALATVALIAGVTPAFATSETTPPNWELQAPEGAVKANTQGALDMTGGQPAQMAARTAARANATDPCPTPRAAKSERPDDLAQVQEDIDRFTLCVQRAQLLERLNDSAGRMAESADTALGFGGMAAPASLPKGGAMPPLPSGALGGLDVAPKAAPAASSSSTTTTSVSTSSNVTATTTEATQAKPDVEDDTVRYSIREIFGPVTDMQARLVSALGDEILVRQGTALRDGAIVTTITPSGVSVRSKGGVKTLEWSGN